MCRAGQCRDDITRRSAGLPYAFLAIAMAEAAACTGPKQLLPWMMDNLNQASTCQSDESGQSNSAYASGGAAAEGT